jgi:hypothetical protein
MRFHIALAGLLFLKSILRQIALYHSNGSAEVIFAAKGMAVMGNGIRAPES